MNEYNVDELFLTPQDEWNETELLHMAATVHDIRRRHADEIMDDVSSPSDTSSNALLSDHESNNNNQSPFYPCP